MRSMSEKMVMAGTGLRAAAIGVRNIKLPALPVVAVGLGMMFLALFVGLVISLGSFQLDVVLTGLLLFPPMLFLFRTSTLLPVMFVVVFAIQGTIQYFFAVRLATWMASALCGLFLLRALIELANFQSFKIIKPKTQFGGGLLLVAASMYLLLFFFSLSLGRGTMLQVISAIRFCVPMFGVLFAMYWFRWTERQMLFLWVLLVIIMVGQLPVVTYQHFFMMSTLGWDGVVGTLGKNMSPILILFTVTAMIYVLARWQNGLMSFRLMLFLNIIGLAVILLGEVKAVFIWLPFGVFWVLRRRILRHVAAFFVFIVLMGVFGLGTYAVYKALYWGNEHTRGSTVAATLDSVGGYAIDPNGLNYETGEISRGASLALWYHDPLPTVHQRLVGYGPGASMTGASTGKGVVAARYRRLQIGATALACLLWDVGVLGAIAFVGMLGLGAISGWRISQAGVLSSAQLSIIDASTAMVMLFISSLIYNRSLLDEPAAQLLCYFCLGCIIQYCRYAANGETAKASGSQKAVAVRGRIGIAG